MAADAMTLPQDRMDAGLKLLALVDSVSFGAIGGGWGYADDGGLWRFYLFTEMVDEKGPLWIWERLLKAFHKLTLPEGMTPLDIVIASPQEWLYRSTLVKLDDDVPGLTAISQRDDLALSGYGVDRMWLLRARPERNLVKHARQQAAASARTFDRRVRQLLAA